MRADAPLLALALAAALSVACRGGSCDPGDERPCTRSLDGGFTQGGYQACGARGEWSSCVPTGACSAPGGAALPVYRRCEADDACGPAGCAVCGHYAGLKNNEGYGICYAYCQRDEQCAPDVAAAGVTPRCVLGQCTLLCRAGARCPRDTECLPWASPSLASANPGFAGLCE